MSHELYMAPILAQIATRAVSTVGLVCADRSSSAVEGLAIKNHVVFAQIAN